MALEQRNCFINDVVNFQSGVTYQYQRYGFEVQGAGGLGVGGGNILTVGSSTTVSAFDNTTFPFNIAAVGDYIVMYRSDTLIDRVHVASVVSGNQITVDTAVNWSNGGNGFGSWHLYKRFQGTTAADAWLPSSKYTQALVKVNTVGNVQSAGGLDISIEGRGYDAWSAEPVSFYTANYAAGAPISDKIVIPENFPYMRVGLRGHTGAANENITVTLIGRWNPYES